VNHYCICQLEKDNLFQIQWLTSGSQPKLSTVSKGKSPEPSSPSHKAIKYKIKDQSYSSLGIYEPLCSLGGGTPSW
jgi:hypothetical protein